jgi:folate-binding protein YgfZ
MADSAFFCVLSHEGVVAVRGSDASKFLQGQLTCNLNYLDQDHAGLGARCTQKGRMQSSFRILLQGDGCLLAMVSELIEPQLADLKKYAVFSKSKLTDESAAWVRFGLQQLPLGEGAARDAASDPGQAVLGELDLNLAEATHSVARAGELIAVRVSADRAELWAPADQAPALQTKLAAHLPQAPLNDWLLGQVRAGIGQVMAQTRELFIPQMLNLQAVGGVSFKKGCYTGQEIVARMQYLGKLKRRLYRVALTAADALPEPGTPLFAPSHNSAIGEVVLAAQAGTTAELLAVLQADAVEGGEIHVGDANGPLLSLLTLPYELDRDREIQR